MALAEDFAGKLTSCNDRGSGYLLSKPSYDQLLDEIKNATVTISGRTRRDYYLLGKYEIMQCGDAEKLIRKRHDPEDPPLYFAAVEDMYDLIHQAHVATGHGGRDRMMKELGKTYANIPRRAVELYKTLCEQCQRKQKRPRVEALVVKPNLTPGLLSRCQVDLIDMQSLPSGQFKWILVYQDHSTKFVLLRPLTSNRSEEVADQLLDIFLTIGPPAILQSDHGSEFTVSVVSDLAKLWPHLKIVHGAPSQSPSKQKSSGPLRPSWARRRFATGTQSQGSAGRATVDIKDALTAWMDDNGTTEWSWGLKFVQFTKNSRHHSEIRQSPFKALFGVEARVGL